MGVAATMGQLQRRHVASTACPQQPQNYISTIAPSISQEISSSILVIQHDPTYADLAARWSDNTPEDVTARFLELANNEAGLILTASVDDGEVLPIQISLKIISDHSQVDAEFNEVKGKIKLVLRRLNRNSEPQASIDSGSYAYHYLISNDLCFICICDRSYPRKLAFTYLSDLASEFTTVYTESQYLAPSCRPYAFVEFDTFIQRTKKTYQDSRATQNLDKLNDELKDVTKVMTKNIEDLLYRGDSLERMGDISSRLREDSRKYKKAAVRINWELLLKQVRITNKTYCVSRSISNLYSTVLLGPWPLSSLSSSGGGSFKMCINIEFE